jgi:cytochrome c6
VQISHRIARIILRPRWNIIFEFFLKGAQVMTVTSGEPSGERISTPRGLNAILQKPGGSTKMGSARLHLIRGVMLAFALSGLSLHATSAFAAATDNYKAKCAMCHGADGKGETPVGKKMGTHDFASPEVQKTSDADLATTIAKGKNKMPAYEKSLKDGDIKELVAYIRQLGKGK